MEFFVKAIIFSLFIGWCNFFNQHILVSIVLSVLIVFLFAVITFWAEKIWKELEYKYDTWFFKALFMASTVIILIMSLAAYSILIRSIFNINGTGFLLVWLGWLGFLFLYARFGDVYYGSYEHTTKDGKKDKRYKNNKFISASEETCERSNRLIFCMELFLWCLLFPIVSGLIVEMFF